MSGPAITVSLGLPVYNGQDFVAQAIESVVQQTFCDFELIISDNGSTDRTRQICESYSARDPRIKYFYNKENIGAAANFNRVFDLSRGKYFKWVAHDDIITSEFLSRCVGVLDRDPSVILCFCEIIVIDEQGRQVSDYDITLNTADPDPAERFRSVVIDWHMCFDVFGLIRSEALRETPVMGNYGHGDGVLLARLALMGKFFIVPEVLFHSRRHAKQSMRVYGYGVDEGGNDYQAYAAWFDPSKANALVFPQWRILYEYFRAVWQPGLQWSARVKSHFVVLWWAVKARRHLWGDVRYAARWSVSRIMTSRRSRSSAQGQ